jgi:hypothetical protein|tara:strand:- start:122 stop:826 length:705 start_codon:yes stop_codon:yes gene_type:complete
VGLRALECLSALLIAAYALLHTGNWTDCHWLWGILKFGINAKFLLDYYYSHYTAKLDADCRRLMAEDQPFGMFNKVEMVALTTKCGFKTLDIHQNDFVLKQGEQVKRLLFAISGIIKVVGSNGGFIARIDINKSGCQWWVSIYMFVHVHFHNFICSFILDGLKFLICCSLFLLGIIVSTRLGEMAYYTGDPASATLVVESDSARFFSWDLHKMVHMSHSHSHSVESVVFRQLPR